MLDDIFFILITCSLEEKRSLVFDKVSNNLAEIDRDFKILKNLIAFDNASTQISTIDNLKNYPNAFQSSKNIGYWSALNWCLNERINVLKRDFKYVYIIESDMLHFDFWKLEEAVNYLEENQDVGTVRTQKFSVAFKPFFSKGNILSMFTHDAINLNAFPSGKKSWFEKSKKHKHIYRSNIHGKLVGLNRLDNLLNIFERLQKKEKVSEEDFFILASSNYKYSAIIDGGIFTDKLASRLQMGSVPMGSYNALTNNLTSEYRATRKDKIINSGFDVHRLNGT